MVSSLVSYITFISMGKLKITNTKLNVRLT